MTNPMNKDDRSTPVNADHQQTDDKNSSEAGRALGWSEPSDVSASGNNMPDSGEPGFVGERQQDRDDGLASDAMGSGSGSDLMPGNDVDDNYHNENEGILGGR